MIFDVFIVGDKLQSITNEKNAFTYFLENEFPSINIIKRVSNLFSILLSAAIINYKLNKRIHLF